MTEHHTVGEYLDAIREGNRTTSDIADYVGVTRQAADKRLRKLRGDGRVTSEKIGNSLVWEVDEGADE